MKTVLARRRLLMERLVSPALFFWCSVTFTWPAVAGTVVQWGTGQPNMPAGLTGVIAISSASDHSLALKSDGTVVAWGYDFDAQCEAPAGLSGVTAIAAGDFFSLAVTGSRVVGWGDNQYGQCHVPPSVGNVVAVSAGRAHALALRSDGTVVAWGNNMYGQCDVPYGVNDAQAVLARWNYSLILRANGTVVAFGADDRGQTDVPPGLNGVVALAGNIDYCLALLSNGSIVAWGSYPIPMPGGSATAIAAGEDHALAVMSDGTVAAWGGNGAGQSSVPGGLNGVSKVAAGWNYSLALTGGGTTPGPFRLINASWSPNSFSVTVPTQPGKTYILQAKDTLGGATWNSVSSMQGNGNNAVMSDAGAAGQQRFYRVVQQ